MLFIPVSDIMLPIDEKKCPPSKTGRMSIVKKLRILKKWCLLLAALLLLQAAPLSARATEPQETEQALPNCTTAQETVSEETETPPEEIPPEAVTPPVIPKATIVRELVSMEVVRQEPSRRGTIDEIPLYYQTDYPNDLYGTGSLANNGCSITCLAMVASYLTDHEYMPDELAGYFGGKAENNVERLEYASDALQLPYEARLNFHETIDGLKEGKVAIVLMESESIFTESQHFIVLEGFNEEGKIMVHDPYEPNYSHWQLKNAFVNGFKEGDILCGFSGGWLYDKSAMPEDPFIYKEEKVEVECRYPDVELTYEEKVLLARMVWVEAQGESAEGQQAVAEVVLNRLVSEDFPDTIKGVIYSEGQFRSTPKLGEAVPSQAQFEAVEQALEGPYVLPIDVVFFATYPVNKNVWGEIGGHIFCYAWDQE